MAEPERVELGQGAVAVVDALGFKEARRMHGVQKLVSSVKNARRRMAADAELGNLLGAEEVLTAAFSDTVIIASVANNLEGVGHGVERLAGATSALVTDAALGVAPLAYRGCIAAGPLLVVDDIFVGDAIDEAAQWYEQALAAVVWLTPSARAAVSAPRSKPALVEWDLPLRDRGPLTVLAVNPFFATVLLRRTDDEIRAGIDQVTKALLQPFETSMAVDVILKQQHTAAFLRAARHHALAVLPQVREDWHSAMTALEAEDKSDA
jgi:hypothetical protein